MGACCCANSASNSANKLVEAQLKLDNEKYRREIKLLLLGAGEAGKSTVLKQMRLIHNHVFTEDERNSYTKVIWYNILITMQQIQTYMEENNIEPSNKSLTISQPSLPNSMFDIGSPEVYSDWIVNSWKDPKVKQVYGGLKEGEVNMNYFFDKASDILIASYTPNDQDILNTRVKTTGITETLFSMNQVNYRLVDVAGQRSERRKWIHCFDNVRAILYVAAISEYDQVLREDKAINRVQEALTLFESISNSEWFINTPTILFLNKDHFPQFTGNPTNLDEVCDFFQKLFLKLHNNPKNQAYPHFTHATDTKQMKHVIESINDIVMNQNLEKLGF
ncbi:heterotrimeric G protein alpha subunit B [Conidiobolus coronatus NRRL 28638]|uniref:Heterotrimeric G protein alpha subunit B n=1 Tax=Conidiobolus coronatus (strain ATCC 28846 / CBS 209.66 / NRRL 28638) TaxID=796925 RepID=A0A137NSG7_CONC2|nr:heterotrimeric G protein alpha subunit B [Conidiobolus coronatus NRRL 28638]|eukprot:KXN65642.1 heterotrimeric G protein alpha subunit B [Conidiobolus coronatus NRRL 28638]